MKLADPSSPVGLWLSAKLLRRAGRLDGRQGHGAGATGHCPITNYTGWTWRPDDTGERVIGLLGSRPAVISASCSLSRRSLLRHSKASSKAEGKTPFYRRIPYGGLWDDAAFVAERVLSADELKAFVDRQPIPKGTPAEGTDDFPIVRLRYLLGRRLVREDRYREATHNLKPPYDKVLTAYVQALQTGATKNCQSTNAPGHGSKPPGWRVMTAWK